MAKIPKPVLVVLTFLALVTWLLDTVDQNQNKDAIFLPENSPYVATHSPYPNEISEQLNSSPSAILVTRVIDGDTIELETGEKVRYIGIDTPEKNNSECFHTEATAKNRELVEGKKVDLIKDVSERDRYGRLLRYVWVEGIFVNHELVRQGYAMTSTYPPDVKYQSLFSQAQHEALNDQLGLWKACK